MEKKILKCFISSPSDCSDERQICEKVISEVNKGIGDFVNIIIEPLMWEFDVIPDIGVDGGAQEVVDISIQDGYEIFVGIMYSRFGTPTKIAGSGTEHEFLNAYKKKKIDGYLPKIFFYFNTKELKINSVDDAKSFTKVQEFKEKLKPEGLYCEFNGSKEFETQFKNHLQLYIKDIAKKDGKEEEINRADLLRELLEKRLSDALQAYSTDPNIWIDPILSNTNDISSNPSENFDKRVEINSILDTPINYIIKAPPEFGLTCLSYYLSLQALHRNKHWVYIDSNCAKPNNIVKLINNEAEIVHGIDAKLISCIILDSWIVEKPGSLKILKEIISEFKDIPLIIMQTIENAGFYEEEDKDVIIERDFSVLHLLALPQSHIRTFVEDFNKVKLLDENGEVVLRKVTKDLEALNLHRTVKNCLTILKAANKQGFDESPVNRTKFIEVVLSVIFEEYEIPNYKQKKPDLKDCEFVLGRFAEILIRSNNYEFTKKFFIEELTKFCSEKLIEIDLYYLFDIFIVNHIFSNRNDVFYFKTTFWLFYFAGHRMFLDAEFCSYIFTTKKYINYPEIIEFYTGIDRNREDALQILLTDIKETCDIVQNKVGFPRSLNPYVAISWNPDPSELSKMKESITSDIISSRLPDIVKDRYDDSTYDQIRPYHQEIRTILENYSLITLMNKIKASSRALRNSDYANTSTKKKLFDEIVRGWNQVSSVLMALSPILADKGYATFEGASFVLNENDFSGDKFVRQFEILMAIPKNVVDYFKNDIYSVKINPLIVEKICNEGNVVSKHELVLMIVNERPKGWRKTIEDYIGSINKNSFFLSDLAISLRIQYHYRSSEYEDRRTIEHLFKMCLAKHEFGDKKPGIDKINQISSNILRNIPEP